MATKEHLLSQADAHDESSMGAAWLAGLAREEGDDMQAARVEGESVILANYAALYRGPAWACRSCSSQAWPCGSQG